MGDRAIPMLSYEDAGAAAEWLSRAFGFQQAGERFTDADGRVTHVELRMDDAVVFVGSPGPDYVAPARHSEMCAIQAAMEATPFAVDGVYVEVGDADAHRERAVAEGARVVRGPEDTPFGRLYIAADPEGHRWMFMAPPR